MASLKSAIKLTPQELEVVNKLKEKSADKPVEIEDIIEAEFLMKFGFEAYWAMYPHKDRSKGISGKEMSRILLASRKIDMQRLYDNAQASFIGAGSAQAKKPSNAFKSMTSKIIKNMKADKT